MVNITLQNHCDSLFDFMHQALNFVSKPEIIFSELENIDDVLADTGQYDIENSKITIYTTNRHPKDILRSVAHELIHHKQNEDNRIKKEPTYPGYAQKSPELRKMEEDAFLRGNMLFRDWSDSVKLQQKQMNESFSQKRVADANKAIWKKMGFEYPQFLSETKQISSIGKQNNRIQTLLDTTVGKEQDRNYTLEMDAAFNISDFIMNIISSYINIANDTKIKELNLPQAVFVKVQAPIRQMLMDYFSPSAAIGKIESIESLWIVLKAITRKLPLILQKFSNFPQIRGAGEVAVKNIIDIVAKYKNEIEPMLPGNILKETKEFESHKSALNFLEKTKNM